MVTRVMRTPTLGQAAPEPRDVAHATLCYDRRRFCAHPRQGGIWAYDGGRELVSRFGEPDQRWAAAAGEREGREQDAGGRAKHGNGSVGRHRPDPAPTGLRSS